jgi:hypothetical protein
MPGPYNGDEHYASWFGDVVHNLAGGGQAAGAGVYAEQHDGVGASIGSVEKPGRAVDLKLGRSTGSGEAGWKGRDLLDLAHSSARGAICQNRNGGPRLVELI